MKKAQEASSNTKLAGVKDNLGMIILEYSTSFEYSSLEDFLKSKIPNEIDSVTNIGDGKLEVEKDGYVATVNADGTIAEFGKTGPRPTVSGIKVVANANGSGENLPAGKTDEGTPLYITFTHSIEGGTTTVSPSIPFKVTANGTYNFTVTGTVNGETSTKAVSVTVNQYSSKYKIGDYVNYTYDTVSSGYETKSEENGYGNQTITQSAETLKWRILNIDEAKGTVDLVSAAPTSNTVTFRGILGYNNGPYVMDKICEALYSNNSRGIKARSIDLIDMEKHLTAAGIAARNAYSSNVKYGTTKTYTSNTKYPSLYAGQKGAGVNVAETNASTIAQPDISKGNDPYEESKPIATTEPTTDQTSGTGNPLTVTQTYYYIPISTANYGDAASVLSNSNYFWVASRCVTADSDIARFGLRDAYTNTNGAYMFDSDGNAYGTDVRLRPVVSLSSSLLTGEKTNDAWNLSK